MSHGKALTQGEPRSLQGWALSSEASAFKVRFTLCVNMLGPWCPDTRSNIIVCGNVWGWGNTYFSFLKMSEWQSLSGVQLFETQWTVACQAPLSMEFSRQDYWSWLPLPSPGDLPNSGIKPRSQTLQADSLLSEPSGKPQTRDVLP